MQNPNPNPNLNLNLLFPQPVLPSELPSQSVIHPPGTDPYALASAYSSIHGGFGSQTSHGENPNAVPQGWVVNQANPTGYTAAINSSNEKSMVSTSLSSLWNHNNWLSLSVANGCTNRLPKQTKVIRPICCEVCNIDCNSKDVFEKHISGKKHKRKLEIYNNPTSTILGAFGVATGEVLETKRQKLMAGGAGVDSVRVCTICNVVCNSQVVFDTHLAGKKHAAQAGIKPPNEIANPNSTFLVSPSVKPQGSCTLEGGPNQTKVVQLWCEVCKIYCDTNDVLNKHKLGKKHQKNLKGLEKSREDASVPASTDAPVTTNAIIGPMENPETDKDKSIVKPETDKDKSIVKPETDKDKSIVKPQGNCTLEGDPKKTQDFQFSWCEVCNIYCNNSDVMIKHKLGKKHQKNLKELEKSKEDTSAQALTDASVTTNAIIGPMENPETDKGESVDLKKKKVSQTQTPEEDLEAKKRKIMECGTTAEAVRTCIICNVVCNSQTVFNSHLTGQKHAAMLKKQAVAGLTTAAPQVVTTT